MKMEKINWEDRRVRLRLAVYHPARIGAPDWWIAAAVWIIAVALSTFNIRQIDLGVYDTFNIFFQADPPRIVANMSAPWLHQARNVTHPIFSILGLSGVRGLGLLGVPSMEAIRLLVVGAGGATAAITFIALRGLALPRAVALGFVAALLASASYLHWFSFVETFAFGGLSCAIMIAVLATAPPGRLIWWTLASAGTLSITTTNWTLGLLASRARLGWRGFAIATGAAFLLVAGVALVQKKMIDHAALFFDPRGMGKEQSFMGPQMRQRGERWEPLAALRSAIVTTAVAPPPEIVTSLSRAEPFTIVTNQFVPLAKVEVPGLVATAAWLFLLGCGGWAVATVRRLRRPGIALMLFLAGQFALHVYYGEITFLYSAHFLPAMIVLAAMGWFTRARRAVGGALLIFVISGAINNEGAFLRAAQLANHVAQAKHVGLAVGR